MNKNILIPKTYSKFISLKQYLEYLKENCQQKLNTNINQITSILVPHAGIQYSGLSSMSAYYPASKKI